VKRAVALIVVATATVVAMAAAATKPPTRVQVAADEFRLALSRTSIRPGLAVIELANFGEDGHDLALRRSAKGARTYRIATVRPGRHRSLEARLVPGRYALWCTLADHRSRGMQALLVVRTP
jgi:plastocyanin